MSLKTHNTADIKDQVGANDISFEVNFDKDHKDYIKVTLANKISVIKKDDLWNMVFSIVEADKQQKMVPVIKQEMIRYIKQHTVKIQHDMKAGDEIAVNCNVNVEELVVDAIRREIEEKDLSTPSPFVKV